MSMSLNDKLHKELSSKDSNLLSRLIDVGDKLNIARRKYQNIEDVIEDINASKFDFKIKRKISNDSAKKIPPFYLRVQTGLNEPDEVSVQTVFSRDKLSLKMNIFFDGSANYKDGDPNWAVCDYKKNKNGEIKRAAIYMPATGDIYFANKEQAYHIILPRYKEEKLQIRKISIPPLKRKFGAEYSSLHTQERSIFKAVFTSLVREKVGGSLHEIGMRELPAAWVGSGVRSHAALGNMKKNEGRVGQFIAEKAGAVILRDPIITDKKEREMNFIMHPDIAEKVMEKFKKAVTLAKGDIVTENTKMLVEPSIHHNMEI